MKLLTQAEISEKERNEAVEKAKSRAMLLNLTDAQAMNLPVVDQYDRICALREIEASAYLARRQSAPVQKVYQKPQYQPAQKKVVNGSTYQKKFNSFYDDGEPF